MAENIILETKNLRREFGALVAVADVSVLVQAGSFHSIIGPNGAGKTTFFNLLSGNLKPTSGQVVFKGNDITKLPLHKTAHLGIGRSFQITNIFPSLTVMENIRLAAQALGKDNFKFFRSAGAFRRYEERAEVVLEQVGLSDRAYAAANTLPHGDQRKLELGMILAPDPEVLLLDEPINHLDIPSRTMFEQALTQFEGTILAVVHDRYFIERFATEVWLVEDGALRRTLLR